MYRVMKAVDKASGYVFGQGDERDMSMMTSSMGAEFDFLKYPTWSTKCICILLYYGMFISP